MKHVFFLILGVVFSGPAAAVDLYGELNAGYLKASFSSTTFNLSTVEARLGAYLRKGVGIELFAATGVTEKTKDNIALTMDYSASLQARFETPESNRGKLFFLLGYGQTSLDMDRSGTGKPGAESFKSGNFGGGGEYRLKKHSNFFLSLKWNRYYGESDIKIDISSLGLRYAF